jgi:hypothetical protein
MFRAECLCKQKDIFELFNHYTMGHFNWKGEWIVDESPLDKAGEYSLKQDLIKELLEVVEKYQGRVKNITIAEAASEIVKKYELLK